MSDQKTLKPGTKPSTRRERIREYETLPGAEALAVLNPEKAKAAFKKPAPTSGPLKHAPLCITQRPVPAQFKDAHLKIFVGLFDHIPRWRKGSTVNFATSSTGYPSEDDAIYAANSLNEAAEEWNRHDVGVQFQWVEKLEDANFLLVYGGNQDGVLASAYFPNDEDLNEVQVYQRSFDSDTKADLTKFFLHELGHVLGLRHEFALEDNVTGQVEGGAVQWGARNEYSVMTYREDGPPEIQQSDIQDTKSFYDFTGTEIGGLRLRIFEPDN